MWLLSDPVPAPEFLVEDAWAEMLERCLGYKRA